MDINKQQQFFGMSAVPKTLLWEISRPAFDILQQTGINSKKFEKNMNSFWRDVFSAVVSMLKLPNDQLSLNVVV